MAPGAPFVPGLPPTFVSPDAFARRAAHQKSMGVAGSAPSLGTTANLGTPVPEEKEVGDGNERKETLQPTQSEAPTLDDQSQNTEAEHVDPPELPKPPKSAPAKCEQPALPPQEPEKNGDSNIYGNGMYWKFPGCWFLNDAVCSI